MALRIGQFVTHYRVSRRHREQAQIVDRFVRERLPVDLGHHLGPSLSRQPAIIRIRYLPVKLTIPVSDLSEDRLSLAWTQAFSRALFTALAYPAGAGPFEIFRADSLAHFLAAAIRDLLRGTTVGHWEYAEFEEAFRMGGGQGALALLCEWPHETLPILLALQEVTALEGVLAAFDDLALERVFATLAGLQDSEPPPLTWSDLFAAAGLVLRFPPSRPSSLRKRSYALSLFVQARGAEQLTRSPRALFHALMSLHVLIESGRSPEILRNLIEEARHPSAVRAMLRTIEQLMYGDLRPHPFQHAETAAQLARLLDMLDDVRKTLSIPPAPAPVQALWISTEWCGIFFLSGTLERLGWIQAWKQLPYFERGGISCLIAGVALAIAGKLQQDLQALDPGLALFSGYTGQPDLAHFRIVFQEYPREVRAALLAAVQQPDIAAESWTATFELFAETLIRSFAARIRGFRQANRQNIVGSFIHRPGRIRVEPERIVVLPEPTPFHVALHVSGIDDPLESLSWLNGRRLEFELGDI